MFLRILTLCFLALAIDGLLKKKTSALRRHLASEEVLIKNTKRFLFQLSLSSRANNYCQISKISCLSRQEIRNQYQPTLLRLRDLADLKYRQVDQEYNNLVSQLNKHQTRSRNVTQTQINNIRKVIVDAKTSPNVTAAILTCLRTQENIANRLSTAPLNGCLSNKNTSDLNSSKQRFRTLSNVASNTVSYCQSLNPLETQVESYGRCLADKVPDLNRQINIIEGEYHELSNGTLHYNIKCLTDNGGTILGQISVISYEINVCFFTQL